MKRTIFLLLLLSGVSAFSQIRHVPDEMIVKFHLPVNLQPDNGGLTTGIDDFDKICSDNRLQKLDKPFAKFASRYIDGERILRLRFPQNSHLQDIIAKIHALSDVEWVERHVLHQVEFIPNDSLFGEQYYLSQISAPDAWDIASDNPVLVGIIDSGVEYLHPDLLPNIWLNPGEDQPPIGILDSADYNGVDDDMNGFIDDIAGWDFVDNPFLASGYDYLIQDNDPNDTFGHGTAVAGILAAEINNSIGIAGAASNARIIVLRAAAGMYLTELAVGQAVLYAVDNGVKVLNMSFGSSDASNLLHDIVKYAYNQGVSIVTSAGNSGGSGPHYPSGYDETISVGAVNQNDQILSSSNRGSTLDLTAPGFEIISTVPDSGYDYFWSGTGTSFSAPLVSAAAAMVLGKYPWLSNEELRGLILSTTDDIYSSGWDSLSGHGRLNIERALITTEILTGKIESPASGTGFAGETLVITGSAAGIYLDNYTLSWGIGYNPSQFTQFKSSVGRQVFEGILGVLNMDSTFIDTTYTIRLRVEDYYGGFIEDRVSFKRITSEPVISDIQFLPAYSGDEHAILISFKTNQLCKVLLRFTGQVYHEFDYPFYALEHLIAVAESDLTGLYNCIISATNEAGLFLEESPFVSVINFPQPPFNANYYPLKRTNILPPGHLLPQTVDFDQDGAYEVLLNQYSETGGFDTLRLFEYNGQDFISTGISYDVAVPRDIGDADADGLLEILCSAFGNTYLYEQSATGEFPVNLVYSDTNSAYGSRILDLFPDDGHGELFVRTGGYYTLFKYFSDGTVEIGGIAQPAGMGALGIPHSEWGDFNDDGEHDVLFGDGAHHIFVMSVDEDYNFTEVFRDSLPFKDTRDFITAGDYDGDGVMEFAAGCHSSTDFVEFGYNLAYWLFYFYDYNITDTTFYRADSICIIGALDPFYYDSGISSGDADGDGKDEIMLCAAPNFYLIDWTETGGYQPNWQYPECFSNQALCFDIDGNGLAELTFNRGYGFASFEKLGGTNLPQAPMNFKVEPLGPDSVKLSWNKVTNVGFYDIRRGMTLTTLVSYSSTQSPSDTVYIDTNVITDSTYYYAVAVYYNFQYGPSSVTQSGIPNYPPELIDWQVFPPNNIRLFFSEPISSSASQTSNYSVNNGIGYPSSAVIESGMNRVLLCFTNAFEQSQYQITLGDIYDQQGSLINNSGPFTFQVMTPDETPYLVRAGLTGQGEVILEFSQQMTVESLEVVSNYSITYGNSGVIDILSASADTTDTKYVHLSTLSEKPMGALGFIYTVTANNIISVSGDTLDVNHNQVTMFFAGDNLKQAFVYPNPVKVEHPDYLVDGESCIVFANLTDNSVVRIYDSGGHHVVTLDEAVFSGGLKWDLVNKNGDRISSGIYIYYITDGVKSVTGKFAVMR